jgi:hypothetical protein
MLHGALAGALLGAIISKPACAGSTTCGGVPLRAVPVAAALFFAIGLCVSLLILIFMERLILSQVFWPTAVNAALVILVVVTIVSRIPATRLSMLIGWFVGAVLGWLIGALLCWLACRTDPLRDRR